MAVAMCFLVQSVLLSVLD